ncbi:UNVERIFIED_CONTAM: hypothetical protein H355_016524 [Colinus virginianus]|nr:hypothetical protein H355_016524 [Colinus virginianus]
MEAAAEDGFYEEAEEVSCYDFEPLPTLLEDEENVSLADILSLRDSCLTEQDIWAICLECCHSLKSIAHSAIFQTLCITPDTLAFNTNGNVCFMEQLSDDPEGAFVPPEFDITDGKAAFIKEVITCSDILKSGRGCHEGEAHIYSLGATLKAAIEYILEPETESEFGQDLHTLLEQMQEENPENRPDIESILSLCEEKLKIASSSSICRSLSAVGRRVLSIESFGASQDACDNMWKGRVFQKSLGSKLYSNEIYNIGDSPAAEDVTATCHKDSSVVPVETGRESGLKEMQIDLDNEKTQHFLLANEDKKSKEDKHTVYTDGFASVALDIKSCVSDLERDGVFKKGSLRKIKTFPKLPLEPTETNHFFTSVTNSGPLARKNHLLVHESLPIDNNNEAGFSKGNLNSLTISSPSKTEPKHHQVTDLHLEASCVRTQVSGLNLEEHMSLINGKKIGFLSSDHNEDCSDATSEVSNTAGMLKSPSQSITGAKMLDNYMALEDCTETFQGSNENSLSHFNKMTSVLTTKPSGSRYGSNLIRSPELSSGALSANNNEDNLCGGRGSEIKSNEQKKRNIDEIYKWISLKLLLSWYGKPLKEHELWALCHECLRTLHTCTDYPVILCLDTVLLDCHGRILFTAPKAEESCDIIYLAPEIEEEDVDTEKVCIYSVAAVLWMAAKYSISANHKRALPRKLKNLLLDMAKKNPEERPSIADAIKTVEEDTISSPDPIALEIENERLEMPSESNLGFMPITSESKLIAVKGPVPCQVSLKCGKAELPVAFTSPATHFKPIILQQNANITNLPVLLSSTIASYKLSMQTENDSSLFEVQNCKTINTLNAFGKTGQLVQTNCQGIKGATNIDSIFSEQGLTPCTSMDEKASCVFDVEVQSQQSRTSDALLQEVVHLIQEEFAFDGYLENGVEVFDMGNFILTLKENKFGVFSEKICEKFCDLYWDEKLLENLYQVVNGERASPLCIDEADDSKCGGVFRDLKKSDSFLASSDQAKGEVEDTFDMKDELMINTSLAEMNLNEMPSDNFKKESRLKNAIHTEKDGECLQSNGYFIGPDFAEENAEPEEEAVTKTAENSYLVPPSLPDFHGCSPGWSSAFYGAECFDSEVHSYMKSLGKQKSNESQSIDAKKVELEQLLMMETKNYRKTIRFYQRLLQKERRNKGPETKSMLTKLRGQLQEMKSRVQFLELVKKNAFLEGYVQQFLYTFRYFCTQEEFLQFILDRISSTLSSVSLDPSSSLTKICNRSFYILQAWIEDCYSVDFATNENLLCTLKEFISSKVAPLNGYGEYFLSLLEDASARKSGSSQQYSCMEKFEEVEEDRKTLHSICKKLSEDMSIKNFNWKLSKGIGPIAHYQRERLYTISSVLPKPCYDSFTEEFPVSFAKADEVGPYLLTEYSVQQLCCQLTLLQQLQVSLLSKFLLIAKSCYEQRNFATAMQILAGLENLIVRQLPAWKVLPAKVAEIMEELKAVEVFLKSDSLCLMEGERFKTLPTIPSARVLAMHVQQLETGGFTMTNGAHKWSKLRNIAKVVSQVHAFQENPYTFTPDFKLQSYLRQRITRFKDADISALAADNCANFHHIAAEKHSRKIQDTLRRMKATFQ